MRRNKMGIPKSTTLLLLLLLLLLSSSSSSAAVLNGHRKLTGFHSLAPSPAFTLGGSLEIKVPFLALAAPELKEICQETQYPEACIKTVEPLITGGVNVISVLKAEIEAMSKSFEMGIKFINSIRSIAPGGSEDCLDTCLESFQMGIDDTADALKAIEARDIDKLITLLSASVTYSTTCEDEFASLSLDSPMAKIDGELDQLGGNALAIANLLDWEGMKI